jgi:hypothetical protein
MLHGGLEDPDLAPVLGVREVGGMVEQLTARQLVNLHHIHMVTLASPTDRPTAHNPFSTGIRSRTGHDP